LSPPEYFGFIIGLEVDKLKGNFLKNNQFLLDEDISLNQDELIDEDSMYSFRLSENPKIE
jgi:hypothetical protein